jgi:hypothetical protein
MKKTIIVVTVIIFLVVAGFISKTIYNKTYTAKVSEEINKLGLNTKDYNLPENASEEDIRQSIIEQEINNSLSKMGISPNEIDLSNLDFTDLGPEEISNLIYEEVVNYKTQQAMGAVPLKSTIKSENTPSTNYICLNDQAITKRGYIVIHGAGGPDSSKTLIKNTVSSSDPLYSGFMYFTYDADMETLDVITNRFVLEYKKFAGQGYDKIVIYGQSAGGVIASRAAYQLGTSPNVDIHTLASPLNGYKFGAAAEQMSQQFSGLNKEIGLGIDSYNKPSSNVKVYHHKTVEDETLRSFCGSYASLCSPSVIQDNDVPGSLKYSYPNDTHSSISTTVITKTLDCLK